MAYNITESLHNGVSTQPEHFRLPGQSTRMVNAMPDLVRGAAKRPGTRLVTAFADDADIEYRLHTIYRDADSQYAIVHGFDPAAQGPGALFPGEYVIRAYDQDGTSITVTIDNDAQDYLRSNMNSGQDTRLVTIVDTTYIINPSVAVDVLPTPAYTVTDEFEDQGALFRHTPTDETYHYAEAEDSYWFYDVDSKTFGTGTFAEVWAPAATPSGDWARTGVHAARLQFGRFDVVGGTTMAFTTATRELTNTGSFAGYSFRAGDLIRITSGTGLSGATYTKNRWFEVESKTDNDTIVLVADARLPGADQTDWEADFIGPRYVVTYNNGGSIDSSMQVIARKLTESVQGPGNYDVLIEFVPSGTTGYFAVTTPTRGADSRFVEALSGEDTDVGPNLLTDSGYDLAAPGITRPFGTLSATVEGTGAVTFGTDDTLAVADRWTQVPVASAVDGTIDADTMPVQMTLTEDGVFRVSLVDWADRMAGDALTNPSPELFLRATERGAITSITVADPTVITSAGHGLSTGDIIDIRGTNSEPRANGQYAVTVTGTDTFTIPLDVDVSSGNTGRWSRNGAGINDATYHRGRLIFVGDEYLVASRQDDLLDFYLADPEQVTDTDRIVVSPGAENVTIITSVTPIRNTLVLSSESGQQFEVTSTGAFTPSNISIDPSTRHKILDIGFTQVGPALYFMSRSSGDAQLREYLYVDQIITSDTSDESAHARGYLPTTLTRLTGDGDSQCVFGLASGTSKVYGYRVSWAGRDKVQQAWFEWTFGNEVLDISCMDGSLWMLAADGDTYSIERLPLLGEPAASGMAYEVHLDRQVTVTGSDSGTDTRFSVSPLIADTSGIDTLVLGGAFGDAGFEYRAADTGAWTYSGANGNIDVPDTDGDFQGNPVILGEGYEMLIEPSTPFERNQAGQAVLDVSLRPSEAHFRFKGGTAITTVDPTPTNYDSTAKTHSVDQGAVSSRDAIFNSKINFENSTFTITSVDARPLEIHYVAYMAEPFRRFQR